MPTRTNYVMDPEYVAKCRNTFGHPPEKPFLELFIPEEFRTAELLEAVQRTIWRLEYDVIWPRMAELLQQDGVKGDLLEFGVFAGGSFRRLIEIFRPTRVIDRYYGFDSFKGLPKPDVQNDIPNFWYEGAFADTSKAEVLRRLMDAWAGLRRKRGRRLLAQLLALVRHPRTGGLGNLEDVELVEGWFSDTLPTIQGKITRVAFVRVDCDLYSSTTDVFNFLSGRLVDGAIIYFDDWTHDAGTGETKAFFEFAEREASRYKFERLLTVSDGAIAVRVGTCIAPED